MTIPSVMLVDDDANLRRVLQLQLQEAGYPVTCANSGSAALERLEEFRFDVVITDIQMPGMDGLDLLERIKERDPDAVVLVITAFGDVDRAVRALKAGAFDFLTKPISQEVLLGALVRAQNFRRLYFNLARQREALQERCSFDSIVGRSEGMRRAFDLVRRAAPRDTSVLIRGETGTGKELFARALHHSSPRRDGPFLSLNCAAIPESLLESAFFGHEKGSFTGASGLHLGCYEEAHEGTLFLDEIGLLPLPLQGKILRVLETGNLRRVGGSEDLAFDVRVVAATSSPLEEMISDGSFRKDLYYRLCVLEVRLPPLRERQGDLPLLIDRLLVDLGAPHVRLDPDALEALEACSWPGNVRELRNVLERALILRDEEDRIRVGDIDLGSAPGLPEGVAGVDAVDTIVVPRSGLSLDDLERRLLLKALEVCAGHRGRAARFLGLGRHALAYRLKKHGMQDVPRAGDESPDDAESGG